MFCTYEDSFIEDELTRSEKWDMIVDNKKVTDDMLEVVKSHLFKTNIKLVEELYEVLFDKCDLNISEKWYQLVNIDKEHLLEGIRLEVYYCEDLQDIVDETFEKFEGDL